jgi:glycosyltransferase involved in cell wall biosynthesis
MEVSIIIPSYNAEQYLDAAIESALDQRFPLGTYEVILVDDGSVDGTAAVAARYHGRVSYLRHPRNLGLPAARNTGIRHANGKFIVHLDADDYISPHLLFAEYLHLVRNPHWAAVSCDYVLVKEHGSTIARSSGLHQPIACGIMFRRETLLDIGMYDETMLMCEERDLRQRLLQHHQIGHVELPLYYYRQHGQNMTNDKARLCEYETRLRAKFHAMQDGQ